MNKKLVRYCLALPLSAAANILMVLAADLVAEEKPKRKAAVLPDESPWWNVVDSDYER